MQPVQLLYHGTSLDHSEGIDKDGLVAKLHDKVYLTSDIQVAYNYAVKEVYRAESNTKQPIICVVDAPQMVEDGFVFNHNNETAEWTVDKVPPNYLTQIAVESESDLANIVRYVKNI